jgi:GT2 family glycosyltransferase
VFLVLFFRTALASDPAGVLLWAHRPDLVESAGLSLFRDGTPAILFRTRPVTSLPAEPVEVLGAYGGAALYRRPLLERIGLVDERFISHGEDMDLALRARLAGFRCALVPSARGTHRHMATSSRAPNFAAYLQYRNIVLYLVKNLRAGFLLRRLPRFALSGLRPLLTAPWRGLGWALVGAKFAILWNLPHVLCERRRIRGARSMPDEALEALFVEGRSRPTAEERPPDTA